LVDINGKEALNFNISLAVCSIIYTITIIGIPILLVIAILHIVSTIIAAVKINNGEEHEYPLTIKFFK